MKLATIVNARKIFEELADNREMPIKLSYLIMKFIIATQGDAEFYAKRANEIMDRYGTVQSDGTKIIEASRIPDCDKEIEALNNLDVETEINKIPLSLFADSINLSIRQMASIIDVLDE